MVKEHFRKEMSSIFAENEHHQINHSAEIQSDKAWET